jgi:glyoxylase-like metal-dependent hydrolase (beta-lactamase superfamily II)
MSARIENVVTAGTFSLDGGTWDVENNVWLIGDDTHVIIIDPAHDLDAIAEAVGSRHVLAILLTHAHDDHSRQALEAGRRFDAPVFLNPDDRVLWDQVHQQAPDKEISDGETFEVAGTTLQALHTPGHSPGSTCFLAPDLGVVFTGDTLFNGGPGATGRSHSDFETIVDSIRTTLLVLPPETRVLTGHGDETTIGAEAPHLQEWIDRGH